MRKQIALLAALFVAISSTFAFSVRTNDDVIPIPLECNESEMDTIIWRGPIVPIHAAVIPAQSIISVTYMNNMGDISIEVANLNTGEEYFYEESSLSGGSLLPFSGGVGYYFIRFRVIGGSMYYGYFTVE